MGSAENEKGCAPVTPARYAHLAVGLLERGAIAHPGRTAVVDEWGSVTYAGLFERAQRLASGLLDRGLGGRAAVVVAEKSADALVAFFGTLMAGGFYAPVAPDAPAGRAGGRLAAPRRSCRDCARGDRPLCPGALPARRRSARRGAGGV